MFHASSVSTMLSTQTARNRHTIEDGFQSPIFQAAIEVVAASLYHHEFHVASVARTTQWTRFGKRSYQSSPTIHRVRTHNELNPGCRWRGSVLSFRHARRKPMLDSMRAEIESIDDRTEQVVLPKSDLRKALTCLAITALRGLVTSTILSCR